jgi:hypothetical protein
MRAPILECVYATVAAAEQHDFVGATPASGGAVSRDLFGQR